MGPNTSKLYENHQKTPETCLFSPKNDENLTKNGVGRHDFCDFLSVYKVFTPNILDPKWILLSKYVNWKQLTWILQKESGKN